MCGAGHTGARLDRIWPRRTLATWSLGMSANFEDSETNGIISKDMHGIVAQARSLIRYDWHA